MSAPWGPREPYDPKSDGYRPDAPLPLWAFVAMLAAFGLVQWVMG